MVYYSHPIDDAGCDDDDNEGDDDDDGGPSFFLLFFFCPDTVSQSTSYEANKYQQRININRVIHF